MERSVYPGEFYRHFKNKLYQIITVAIHSETRERMVVYQALYGDFKTYVRPYEMFVSEVDHEKYPEVKQKYRFEKVMLEEVSGGAAVPAEVSIMAAQEETRKEEAEPVPNPALLRFLDAEGYEEQMECLNQLAATATQADLDSIYVVLDMKPQTGDIRAQLRSIEKYLSLQEHFDGKRLR